MKSWQVHYENKFPGCSVDYDERSFVVFHSDGRKLIDLRKNGAECWVDLSSELGCASRHDLAPIPKNTRRKKLFADGRVGRAEEYDERKPLAEKLASGFGYVPSIEELEARVKGVQIDDKGNLIIQLSAPAQGALPPPPVIQTMDDILNVELREPVLVE